MLNGFIYVVYAHFIDKIEKEKKYPGPKCLWFHSSKMTQTKKEKKLTFLNHLLAPTFLAQNPKNKK